MTAHTACAAAHQKAWAAACTTRRGTRRWRGATCTALVCARVRSFRRCVAAAAGTTRRWCGCGTRAPTRARTMSRCGATTSRCSAARLMRRGTPCAAVRTRCPVCRRLRRRRRRRRRLHRRLHHPPHLRLHHHRRLHRRLLRHLHHRLHPPRRRPCRRPRHGSASRRCGAQSWVGRMTAHTACAAAHQKAWAAACTTRRGTRRWRGATCTALVCARVRSFRRCVAAAAGTTRRWCGCGTRAPTRARTMSRCGATTSRCSAARLMRRGTPCAAVRTRCPVCRRLRRRRRRRRRLHRRLHHPPHLRLHHHRRLHRRLLRHLHHRLHPPRRRPCRRPRHGSASRRCGAQSWGGRMTARTACAAAHQKAWVAACTTRRGTRRWRGAACTALVCARVRSFPWRVAAAAGTTRRWCGCGTSARRHHLL